METVLKRGEQRARVEQRRLADRVADRWRMQAAGLRVTVDGGDVAIGGRGLVRRWLADPGLRFIGGSAR